ncbi:hypothetical protein K7711_11945 [Nocardia sp. CA2R105]|uniref:hypothetical protein n=1 Tax=Nocardia coffeae TaxID=2873381 RepID=UPI001CA7504F|nr:hypothetical protein [Nocardia coffeae]MBY8857193.1 hypothetical protein [Nocardia coffeae]
MPGSSAGIRWRRAASGESVVAAEALARRVDGEVSSALDQARGSEGPARIIVHPNGAPA